MVKSSPSKLDVKQLEDIATLKADMNTVKADLKDVKHQIGEFINTADKKYATKEEVADIKSQVRKNENRIYSITKEVATWGTTIALMTKLLGMW